MTSASQADAAPPEPQTCPRRLNDWGQWERTENLDRWETGGHGLVDQAQAGRSCSFCGSLHPDDFMRHVADGWIVSPTDKAYKAYLIKPYTAEEIAARREQWMQSDSIARAIRELGERDGKTAEQITADLDAEWNRNAEYQQGKTVAKFYFQHLSDEQCTEFINMHNSGRMKVQGGGFYVLPYFCVPAAGSSVTPSA